MAGEVSVGEDSGIPAWPFSQGSTVVKFAPAAGANVFSIRLTIECLVQPESIDKLPGVGFGNPVLYPTPNRVKNATFEFSGTSVRFQPNAQGEFYSWTGQSPRLDARRNGIRCRECDHHVSGRFS